MHIRTCPTHGQFAVGAIHSSFTGPFKCPLCAHLCRWNGASWDEQQEILSHHTLDKNSFLEYV